MFSCKSYIWFIADVTPPSLTFVTNPSLTKSNASITWTVSEPVASSKCTVTFPNGTVVNETCNDQWEAIDLPRGTYQISIVLVDTAGLIGGAFRHTWTNSKWLINEIFLCFKAQQNIFILLEQHYFLYYNKLRIRFTDYFFTFTSLS